MIGPIKLLIDKAKSSIIDTFKEENSKLLSVVNSLTDRVQDLESKNHQLELRCQQLEVRKNSSPGPGSGSELLVQEAMSRHERRNNLIVSGLPEPSHGTVPERHADFHFQIKKHFTTTYYYY